MKSGFDLYSLVRPNILSLKPYRSARDDFKEGILLDANENPFSPQTELKAADLNRYPDPHQTELRKMIADKRGLSPLQVFLGNGSDEAIDLIIRMFCRPGQDKIMVTPPTYGMYKVSADIHQVETLEIPLQPDFSLSPDDILANTDDVRIIFLCSPNNPSANLLERDAILQILQEFNGIVVVDEAYIDFSPASTLADELSSYPNLIILQTLSKAYGLAGIRLGMALASKEIIRILMTMKPPYNINTLTQQTALALISDSESVSMNINRILKERLQLTVELSQIPTVKKIFPSDANFILVKIDDAKTIYRKLADKGVIVRYRGDQIHCDNCLRITVGTPEENGKLIQSLKDLCP